MENNDHITDTDGGWYLPPDYKPGVDKSTRYIVSEIQLRKLFCMRFNPMDFNTDFVKEFISHEKLSKYNENI